MLKATSLPKFAPELSILIGSQKSKLRATRIDNIAIIDFYSHETRSFCLILKRQAEFYRKKDNVRSIFD